MRPDGCVRPPDPAAFVDPDVAYRNLTAWAHDRGIGVVETDVPALLGPGEEGTVGTIGDAGGRHLVYVDPDQSPDQKVLTLAHETAHLLLEFGRTPPAGGHVIDPHGRPEPRAYTAEDIFGAQTGTWPLGPGEALDLPAVIAEEGWAPIVVACQLVQAARSSTP